MSPSRSAISRWGGVHTVQGGIDLEDLIFRPPSVGVAYILTDIWPGGGTLLYIYVSLALEG